MRPLCSALIAATLTLVGCLENSGTRDVETALCVTEDGPVLWTGKCVDGVAHGGGSAIFKDSYITTIKGEYVNGVPSGVVRIDFSNGGYYEGVIRDGEPHGYGIEIEPWGEGYEGYWLDGFKDGEGIYIRPDGTRIPGTWRKGHGLVGSWYTDRITNCRFWWKASSDPVGEAIWSGPCVDGKASGAGTVSWSVAKNGASLESEVSFEGTIVDGYIQGDGVWHQIRYNSNVVTTSVFNGFWKDGQRTGLGMETRTGEYREGEPFDKIVVMYEGDWHANEYSGTGRREEIKHDRDGRTETLIEDGSFSDNMLNGRGVSREESERADGTRVTEISDGIFENRQFIGFGTVDYSSESDRGTYRSITSFDGHVRLGGTGTIEYSDGDSFVGSVDVRGQPQHGNCDFASKNYNGLCSFAEFPTFDASADICLVSEQDPTSCMKLIGSWIF